MVSELDVVCRGWEYLCVCVCVCMCVFRTTHDFGQIAQCQSAVYGVDSHGAFPDSWWRSLVDCSPH